jgi:hypothetical protein
MFRSNPLGSVLVSVLFFLALGICWLTFWHFLTLRELYNIQARYRSLQGTLNTVQALANESIAYSQRNPSIDPLLQEFGMKGKPGTATSPAGQPAPKPVR